MLEKKGMKKLILLLSFTVLTFFSKSQTWVYHPMPESNATWNFNMYIPCWSIISLYEDYSITITGDTLINSQTYHKLFTPFVEQSYPGTTCGINSTGYKGAIRQDTTLKKVFFIPYDTIEKLLYDFNMQVGDTLKGYLASYLPLYDTVISIDSILVGSNYRKIWFLNQFPAIYFIEGIGSTYDLTMTSPGTNAIGTFPEWSLNCFSQDGNTLFPDTISNCQLITSVYSLEKFSNQINVFPNPSTGSFTIETENSMLKEIQLTDLLGKKILFLDKIEKTKISIDNINRGTYILTITDKENNSTNKKIVICQ